MICKPNASGRCQKNKDIHPVPAALLIDIDVADRGYYGEWMTPDELIARAKDVGEPIPSISDVSLKGAGTAKRNCWVARVLMYGDLWEETYGLIVDDRRFMVRVFYNDEPTKIESFRSSVIDILSSLALTGQKN